jgi:hypothetical protein
MSNAAAERDCIMRGMGKTAQGCAARLQIAHGRDGRDAAGHWHEANREPTSAAGRLRERRGRGSSWEEETWGKPRGE